MGKQNEAQASLDKSIDAKLSHWLHSSVGSKVPRSLLIWLEHSGNGLFWIPAALACSFSRSGSISTFNIWSANVLAALMLDLAAVGTLKGLVRRARPAYNDSTDFLTVATVDSFSFPSGHTSRVVMLACLCRACAPSRVALIVLTAVWALIVACSRVVLGRHYVTDVMGGVLLGIGVSLAVTKCTWDADELILKPGMLNDWHERLFASFSSVIQE